MRDNARLPVLEALLHRPGMSRGELSERVGMSRATITTLLHDLEEAGLVEQHADEVAERRRTIGRPPLQVSLAPGAAYAVGIDLAQDHVRAAVCDLGGEIVATDWAPVALDDEPEVLLARAAAVTRTVLDEVGLDPAKVLGAGVGVAAPVDQAAGTIHPAGSLPRWRGVALREELERRLALPVQMDNDANTAALGEHLFGAGRGAQQLAVVRLSAGVGLGLILDGRLYRGTSGVAGELGHVRLQPDGLICRCGGRGCLETIASPLAITALLEHSLGEPVTFARLLELVRSGRRGACRAVADAGAAVGEAVATTINLLNPERIVIGGELAEAGAILLDPIREAVERQAVAPAAQTVRVVEGQLGERATVLGAAALQLARAPYVLASRLAEREPAVAVAVA